MRMPLYTGHLSIQDTSPGPQGVHNRGAPLYSYSIFTSAHHIQVMKMSHHLLEHEVARWAVAIRAVAIRAVAIRVVAIRAAHEASLTAPVPVLEGSLTALVAALTASLTVPVAEPTPGAPRSPRNSSVQIQDSFRSIYTT